MGLKFNPPPGWPLPYDFEPPPGWEPDPSWPSAPPHWPLWMGSDAPPATHPSEPRGTYSAAPPALVPPGYLAPGYGYGSPPAGKSGRASRSFILRVIVGAAAAFAAISFVAASASHRSVSDSRATTSNQQVSVFALRAGDCFESPPYRQLIHGVLEVTAVNCAVAHNAQIFAQFLAPDGSYPGRKALVTQSAHDCRSKIATRLDRTSVTRTMVLVDLFPDSASWAFGRRTIYCVVFDSATDLTSSVLKARKTR